MSLYAFHLGQIISTVLGQVDRGGQDGNAARTRIRDKTSETDHTQKRCFCDDAICRTIIGLANQIQIQIQKFINVDNTLSHTPILQVCHLTIT